MAPSVDPYSGLVRIALINSGLGLLAVGVALHRVRPDADLVLATDPDGMPWGPRTPEDIIARAMLCARATVAYQPDVLVMACNTGSVHALDAMRAEFEPDIPVIGTVPAIKPAAAASRSRLISVLATRGTVARDYTHALVRDHAANCEVTLVGSPLLAVIAERVMRDEAVEDAEIGREIAPCFVEHDGRRTDQIVLACTHFPLIADRLERLSPWPVGFVDPAPAIARRLDALIGMGPRGAPASHEGTAIFTSGEAPPPSLQKTLRRYGLMFTPAAMIGFAPA
jgi:glutamate racemase